MQTNQFTKYLVVPNGIKHLEESEAKVLINEFPYCQSGQLLLALKLKENNKLSFEEQLKKVAIYSADRKKLHDLVALLSEAQPIVEKEIDEKKSIEPSETIESNIILVNESTPVETSKQKIPNEIEVKENTLEIDYFNEMLSSHYSVEMDTSTEGESQFTKENIEESQEYTFSDWLKKIEKDSSVLTKNEVSHKNNRFDLIDKFIQEDPKITPKKTEFYSPVNMARLSVVDESEMVSETLALIQVNQGDYLGAIKTYEKLSLKNPKKRTYFAAQIKILKQKIK